MSDAVVEALQNAWRSQYPVEIERELEGWVHSAHGFVVTVVDRWVVLQSLAEAAYLDGYVVLRIADITQVVGDREGGYVERAVAGLGGRPEPDFHLPVAAQTVDVLQAAAAHSSLISVCLEAEADSPRLIGRLDRLGKKKFDMYLINPRGVWTTEPSRWRFKDVTSVSFGGRYVTALERFGEELQLP